LQADGSELESSEAAGGAGGGGGEIVLLSSTLADPDEADTDPEPQAFSAFESTGGPRHRRPPPGTAAVLPLSAE